MTSFTLSLSRGTYELSLHTQSSTGRPRQAQPDTDSEPRRARAFSLPPGLLAAGVDPQIFCGVWGQSEASGEKKRDGRRMKSTSAGMPRFCRAAQKRGDGLMQSGLFREALLAYSTALKAGATSLSDSRKSLIYAYRSRAYLGCGDKQRAKQDASLSLALDPNSKQAQDSKAHAHAAIVADITLASGQVLDLDLGKLKIPGPHENLRADDLGFLEGMHQETPRFRRHLQKSRSETQMLTLATDGQDNSVSLPSSPLLSRSARKASRVRPSVSADERTMRVALAKLAATTTATGGMLCSTFLSQDERERLLSKVCTDDDQGVVTEGVVTQGLASLRSAQTRRYVHTYIYVLCLLIYVKI
jgi:hypothetical protein